MKKKIGISFTRSHFQNYWDWFTPADLGDDLELVELSFEKNNLDDIQTCNAFLLSGGVDIQSALYNGAENYLHHPDEYQAERDHFETIVFRQALATESPLLCICRGLQLANVLLGGTLIEDLGEKNETHKKGPHGDRVHGIKVNTGSLLYEVAGSGSGTVNSAHHQAIDQLGSNLMVSARSANDDVIEAIEYENKSGKPFFLCVQWHPERMAAKNENPFSSNIKNNFLEATRNC